MKRLQLRITFFTILYFVVSISYSQIKVSEIIQESKIANEDANKLYFVDFWATWCGPCVYAKEMLTVLQQQHPKDFYVISLSDENADKVKAYLKKKPSKLAIAVDFEGNTFKSYDIYSRPNGILFNAKGEKLWQGHPADLSSSMISRFLRQNQNRKSLSKFVKEVKAKSAVIKDYQPKDDLEIKYNKNENSEFTISYGKTHLKLDGSLDKILSYISKVNEKQILVKPVLNKNYTVYIRLSDAYNPSASHQILDKLGLEVKESEVLGEALTLKVRNPNFWDTNQINWGDVSSKYLVSDSDISADNVSLKDVSYQLSKALDIPVVISSSNDTYINGIHDWQVHYKYYEFMQSNFEEYGIKVKKEKVKYPQYIIIKKAP
ncbi:TlpA family protein disulfide reductase [Winogradskyella wandonensis]|nr:TlpA disulfide reductase family protein [Winogradskyella wandonensis]